MRQKVDNNGPVERQINIGANEGNIYITKPTRWSKRFARLKEEVDKNIKIEKFIDDLVEYNTVLDGKSMPDKLKDGGFSESEILNATKRKQQYWKKFEKNKFFETAQVIDTEIFALIKFNFETYINPLIEVNADKITLKAELNEKVISPILLILNEEGYDDVLLNYSVNDILGMLYFLTGKCHINWAVYDNL